MQTYIVKVRKDGLLSPSRKMREHLRRLAGDELEILMRHPRAKTPADESPKKLTRKVREQLRRRDGEELETVMRPPHAKTPLEKVREKLNGLVTPDEAERWLHASNKMFEGRRPIDLIITVKSIVSWEFWCA